MNDLNKKAPSQMTDEEYELYGKFSEAYLKLQKSIDAMEDMIKNLRTQTTCFHFEAAYNQLDPIQMAIMDFKDALPVPYKIERSYEKKREIEYRKRGGE